MARYTGPVCRLCRRDGLKLFLKGTRCDTPKCPIEKENKPPGVHGAKRIRLTEFGIHLREVQRAKKMYGVMQKQFRRYYDEAIAKPGNTGEYLMQTLERRLVPFHRLVPDRLVQRGRRRVHEAVRGVDPHSRLPPIGPPHLVADPIEQRLPQVGLQRPVVARLEILDVLQRLGERVLHQVLGVAQVARPARQPASGPASERPGMAPEQLVQRLGVPKLSAPQQVRRG